MSTLYVAGPMRNRPKFNFPLFDEVAQVLRRKGHDVINPADMDRARVPDMEEHAAFQDGDIERWEQELGFNFHKVIGQDLVAIINEADGIVLLPEWEQSTGAGHEKYVAEATGKTVGYAYKTPQGHWLFFDYDYHAFLRANKVSSLQPTPTPVTDLEKEWTMLHHRDPEPVYAGMREAFGGSYREQRAITFSGVTLPEISTLPQVVGLVGFAQVGKDTLGGVLVRDYGYTRLSFADVLRDCLYALNPIITLKRIRVQDIVDEHGWDWAKVNRPEIRELLQRLGTEVGRNILGEDIWVETALRKIEPGKRYVITDVRFPNEFKAIQKLGGTLVRIYRQGYGPVNDHPSEHALDAYTADVSIDNNGTVIELEHAFLKGIK